MDFSALVGKTLAKIDVLDGERIIFTEDNGTVYASYHMQACCESVGIDRTEGVVENAIGSTIIEAEETQDSEIDPPEYPDSWTWTRQRIRTAKGEVTFVWLGESKGYYGETPYFGLSH